MSTKAQPSNLQKLTLICFICFFALSFFTNKLANKAIANSPQKPQLECRYTVQVMPAGGRVFMFSLVGHFNGYVLDYVLFKSQKIAFKCLDSSCEFGISGSVAEATESEPAAETYSSGDSLSFYFSKTNAPLNLKLLPQELASESPDRY